MGEAIGQLLPLVVGPSAADDGGQPATWASLLKLVLGVLLVLLAVRQWRARPAGSDDAPTPRWMGAIDGFGPVKLAEQRGSTVRARSPRRRRCCDAEMPVCPGPRRRSSR
jgi:hypothetical protein